MAKIKELWQKYREIITYLVFGVLTTLVNLAVYTLMNRIIGHDLYLISNVVAWIAAVVFAYIVNKLFVFESKSFAPATLWHEIPPFVGARLFSLGVEEGGLWLLVDACGMKNLSFHILFDFSGQFLAKAILAVIVVVLNYFFSKFLIFNKK